MKYTIVWLQSALSCILLLVGKALPQTVPVLAGVEKAKDNGWYERKMRWGQKEMDRKGGIGEKDRTEPWELLRKVCVW